MIGGSINKSLKYHKDDMEYAESDFLRAESSEAELQRQEDPDWHRKYNNLSEHPRNQLLSLTGGKKKSLIPFS